MLTFHTALTLHLEYVSEALFCVIQINKPSKLTQRELTLYSTTFSHLWVPLYMPFWLNMPKAPSDFQCPDYTTCKYLVKNF